MFFREISVDEVTSFGLHIIVEFGDWTSFNEDVLQSIIKKKTILCECLQEAFCKIYI